MFRQPFMMAVLLTAVGTVPFLLFGGVVLLQPLDAPILVLDEPCAGLDVATEMEFMRTLNNAVTGRTVLLILHRLTGAEQLDRIWRLTAGTLVAAAG